MRLSVYAVFDDKAKAFLPPWFMPNTPMALRTFSDCVNMADHQFGKHPADYSLFCFGAFDCDTGKFDLAPAFELIANGVMCKEPRGSLAASNGAVPGVNPEVIFHENA